MKKLSGNEIKEYEPYATGVAAIHVPYTGIIDYRQVCQKYAEIFCTRFGGEIYLNEKVHSISMVHGGANVLTTNQDLFTKLVINTAGLYSDKVAELILERGGEGKRG